MKNLGKFLNTYQSQITHHQFKNRFFKPDVLMKLNKITPQEQRRHPHFYNQSFNKEWSYLVQDAFLHSKYINKFQTLDDNQFQTNKYNVCTEYRLGSENSKSGADFHLANYVGHQAEDNKLKSVLLILRPNNDKKILQSAKKHGFHIISGEKACSKFIKRNTGRNLINNLQQATQNVTHLDTWQPATVIQHKRGTYVDVEGLDGTGKSTTEKVLQQNLEKHGKKVILTHEPFMQFPNGRPYLKGKQMFAKIENPNIKLTHQQKRNMFARNAREHMKLVVRPALKKGQTVLCDRGLLSSIAYQGIFKKVNGKTKDINHVIKANQKIQGKYFTMPDKTVYLYLKDNNEEISRIQGRNIDIGKEDLDDRRVIKNLNTMKKKYQFGLKAMQKELHVPYESLDAHQLPDVRAKKLEHTIHHAEIQNNLKPNFQKNFKRDLNSEKPKKNVQTKKLDLKKTPKTLNNHQNIKHHHDFSIN